MPLRRKHFLWTCAAGAVFAAAPARSELVLSELIVELQPGKQVREDVEIWNNSPERSFVAVEPREIINPGQPSEKGRTDPDPEKLGLLVSPARLILEPGQRKLVRIATMSPETDREHVYRVAVRPVVSGIQTDETGLKVVVGYDVLVLVRPVRPQPSVTAKRTGRTIEFGNSGNVSVEIIDGHQCMPDHKQCTKLPGKRLYPRANWAVALPSDRPVEYTVKSPGRSERRVY